SVAQDTGQQSGDRLDHDQGRRLPSVEDVVADTEFFHRHVFRGFLRDPGVDALVASTAEDEVLFLGQPFRVGLPERATAGCGQNEAGGTIADDRVECLSPRFRFHDQAGPTAVGGVVDGVVSVVCPGTQVVDVDVEQTGESRLADQGKVQGREVVGKDTDDVDAHGVLVRSGSGCAAEVEQSGRG